MVSLPATRLLPFTVRLAVALAPETTRTAVASETPPAVKVTLPVGAALPLTAFTVAVN
jgi:hypothetical protein